MRHALLGSRRLGRAFFVEFDFTTAWAALWWAALAWAGRTDLADNEWFRPLAFMSDRSWGITVGAFGLFQLLSVLWNDRWARWTAVLLGTFFWCTCLLSFLLAAHFDLSVLPQSAALYGVFLVCSFLCVCRMPRDYPPRTVRHER